MGLLLRRVILVELASVIVILIIQTRVIVSKLPLLLTSEIRAFCCRTVPNTTNLKKRSRRD